MSKYLFGFTEKTTEPLDSELMVGGTGAAPDYTFRWGNMAIWLKNKLFGSATVWTSDNDGVGSGLDADTLQNETPATLRDRALHTGDAPAVNVSIDTNPLTDKTITNVQLLAQKVDANPADYIPQGEIDVAADFPTLGTVQPGWLYVITSNVTDNDAAKTNTGQSFLEGVSIVWAADGSWLDLGSNYVTQAQKDKLDGIDERSSYSNVGYIAYSSDTDYLNIDLDNSLVEVFGSVFIYMEHGFKFIPAGNYVITVGHRYILWDDINDVIYTSTLDLITNSNKDSYIIAAVRNNKLVYFPSDRYRFNGTEISGSTDGLRLEKEDRYRRDGYISYPDPSSSFEIDFINSEITVGGNVFVFVKDGFKFVPIGVTALNVSDRYILWDNTNDVVLTSAADLTVSAESDIYIIATIRSDSNEVMTFNSNKYIHNGVLVEFGSSSSPIPAAERHNLIDYVVGQENIAEKYSIPVCDLYRESGLNFLNSSSFIQVDLVHYEAVGYTHIAQQTTEFIKEYGGFLDLTGKTIGVFGGSYSVIIESQACKNVWVSELGITYTDHGVGGAGFSSLASSQIDAQVDLATSKDIFIIWCSGNDAGGNVPILEINTSDVTSQSYGMTQTITKLVALNPTAKIFIFNSLKYYTQDYFYDPTVDRF